MGKVKALFKYMEMCLEGTIIHCCGYQHRVRYTMQNFVCCKCCESPAAQRKRKRSEKSRKVGAVTWDDVSEDASTSSEQAP